MTLRAPLILIAAMAPTMGQAWSFSPDPICTLTHQADAAEIAITYDDSLPEYALFITLRQGEWPASASFEMTFQGGIPVTIGTTRHVISADGATLSVRDRGFGNVLDGIEFNAGLAALAGGARVTADTRDAAEAVQAFRACPADIPALS
ncbi:hypothetical protein [Pseudooctadecabacter jejudonensis]|uniref:Excinuclease ABC subunit B n=1 Tax=Pseudooctadecabacter jejudonensis TaxID=1391910 RepID=A0A1Y5SW74_9RHOB|nr:hypothetical protein [Pseudooctadecabacter jejudonensis]SLN46442.1 hypothetical protein PSJ8397_02425 [Pseudooctadecabacter jejudonensis]